MLGLRFTFSRPGMREPLTDGRLEWLWNEADAAALPIMVMVPRAMVELIDRVAERHPGLKLVMDHLSMISGTKDDEAFADLDKLLAIAKRANVAVKATALPCYTDDSYPYRRIHGHLRRVYDAFGPKRVFWGTDLSRLPCTYRQAITMFTEEIPWLTTEDKEWIMGRGVCEWLGWTLP
jgi:predicted TIM-barrel fold metal-dependent hydrolase